jgi:hypothetical protein
MIMLMSLDDGMSMPPPESKQAQASNVMTPSAPAITIQSRRAAAYSTPLTRSHSCSIILAAVPSESVDRSVARHVEHADMTVTVGPIQPDRALAPGTAADELGLVVCEPFRQH